jgi:hypothetical protein
MYLFEKKEDNWTGLECNGIQFQPGYAQHYANKKK